MLLIQAFLIVCKLLLFFPITHNPLKNSNLAEARKCQRRVLYQNIKEKNRSLVLLHPHSPSSKIKSKGELRACESKKATNTQHRKIKTIGKYNSQLPLKTTTGIRRSRTIKWEVSSRSSALPSSHTLIPPPLVPWQLSATIHIQITPLAPMTGLVRSVIAPKRSVRLSDLTRYPRTWSSKSWQQRETSRGTTTCNQSHCGIATVQSVGRICRRDPKSATRLHASSKVAQLLPLSFVTRL